MLPDGLFLNAAFLCANVLVEADGVYSAIRILDYVEALVPEDAQAGKILAFTPATLHIYVSFSSLGSIGPQFLEVALRGPDSTDVIQGGDVTIDFSSQRGVKITNPVNIPMTKPGIIWVELSLNREPMTRFPLEVRHTKVIRSGPSAAGEVQDQKTPL